MAFSCIVVDTVSRLADIKDLPNQKSMSSNSQYEQQACASYLILSRPLLNSPYWKRYPLFTNSIRSSISDHVHASSQPICPSFTPTLHILDPMAYPYFSFHLQFIPLCTRGYRIHDSTRTGQQPPIFLGVEVIAGEGCVLFAFYACGCTK